MTWRGFTRVVPWIFLLSGIGRANVVILVEHNDDIHATPRFQFQKVPAPSSDDAATHAIFTVLYGAHGGRAGNIDRIHDGKLPMWEDQPEMNFAFTKGDGGRVQVDLEEAVDIAQVNSYSWHPGSRGPQVYRLYGGDEKAAGFNPTPGQGVDPVTCGWTQIASVDTRPKQGEFGGQYGVSILDPSGGLGRFRFLLLDISATENTHGFANTFYSEFDVVSRDAKPSGAAPVVAARHDPPGDPMSWRPPTSIPVARERYPAVRYAPLASAARSKINLDALRVPGRPVGGAIVQEVFPSGQAAGLGIRVGDVLESVDGIPLGSHGDDEDLNATRTANAQQLAFWSPVGGHKHITIQPGKLGLRYDSGWRIADSYARSPDRDPKWDDYMLVAASTLKTDPELAETALFHAQRSGYRGLLLAPLGARIAYAQGRFEDTLAWGWPAWSHSQRLNADSILMFNDAAVLSFKLDQAIDLARRYAPLLAGDQDLMPIVAAYRAMPKSKLSDPWTELDSVRQERVRQFDADNADAPENLPIEKWVASVLSHPQPLPLKVPSGHHISAVLTPGLANLALNVSYQVQQTDQIDTNFASSISFGMFDLARQEAGWENGDAIKVSLMTDGSTAVTGFGLPTVHRFLPRPALEGTIGIVVLHNRCLVTLDGQRIFYGPVVADESKRSYGLYIQGVGVTGQVFPPVWERLTDPRAVAP
jgi:hypothetical protein